MFATGGEAEHEDRKHPCLCNTETGEHYPQIVLANYEDFFEFAGCGTLVQTPRNHVHSQSALCSIHERTMTVASRASNERARSGGA